MPAESSGATRHVPRGAILVTGGGGFVGRALLAHLLAAGDGPIVATHRPDGSPVPIAGVVDVPIELTERNAVEALVELVVPREVYHLAAQSSVADSHRDPHATIHNNVDAQLNLFEALLGAELGPRTLVVGSNEEYGRIRPDEVPVSEGNELRPISPYAVSKVAQDLLGYQYFAAHGLPVIRARPFTHTGPGQDPRFATPSFARQIARIEHRLQPPVVTVGNLEAQRDVSDVRDVVTAYRLLLQRGEPGEAYNVGSERAVSIQWILDTLIALSTSKVTVEIDPARMRPTESSAQYSDCSKLRAQTGWKARLPLQQTLKDVLNYWRERVSRQGEAC